MEEKIKDIEVIAYKGIELDMSCGDFQYEIGKTYKTDKAELCNCGFHACLNPLDVLDYYSQRIKSRYFKVKLSGEITKCDFDDTEVAATEMTIIEEINIKEAIKTEWWKSENVLDLLYYSDGFARVRRSDRKYNLIDANGKLLLDEWFEWVDYFHDGFAQVRRAYEKYNYIDKNGKILLDEWYKWADDFRDGFARVRRSDRKYNYIDKQGKLLSEQWFEWVGIFYEGFAIVQKITNSLYNFIDTKGRILSGKWFSDAHSFNDGLAKVKRTSGEQAKIDKNGKIS